jgi:hypothetical protein
MARNRAKHHTLAPLTVATLAVFSGIGLPATAVAVSDLRLDTGTASYAPKLAPAPYPAAPGDRPDADKDGLFDDDETNVYGTNPAVADTDGDGTSDGEEVYLGTDPKVSNPPAARPDGDKDGLYDDDEKNIYGTNPAVADTDKDGVTDGEEVFNKTDPKVANNPAPNPNQPPNPDPKPAPAEGDRCLDE